MWFLGGCGEERLTRVLTSNTLFFHTFSLFGIKKNSFFEVLENYQLKNKKEQYYAFMRSALGRSFQLILGDVLDETKKENLLTIAKFAKLCDVPVSTIRYWMKEGHIKPVVFTPTGYALFDENQRIDIQEAKLTKMISKCMSSLKKGIEKAEQMLRFLSFVRYLLP